MEIALLQELPKDYSLGPGDRISHTFLGGLIKDLTEIVSFTTFFSLSAILKWGECKNVSRGASPRVPIRLTGNSLYLPLVMP